jgi:hypothetical protein
MAKYSISNGAKVNRLLIKYAVDSMGLYQQGDERKPDELHNAELCEPRFNSDF